MCGIIAVVRRPSDRRSPDLAELLAPVEQVAGMLAVDHGEVPPVEALLSAASGLAHVDELLRGPAGVLALLGNSGLDARLDAGCRRVDVLLSAAEASLDAAGTALDPGEVERTNAALIRLRDALWAVGHDRLGTALGVAHLAGDERAPAAVASYLSMEQALAGLDRLEVRGRDSAGLAVLVDGHGLREDDPAVAQLLSGRHDPLFRSGAVEVGPSRAWTFVYKAAAEIGELGDNTRVLRAAVRADELLRLALSAPAAQATVLAHTRWASVGIISQANAHPLDSHESGSEPNEDSPFTVAALNGDVDNFADVKSQAQLAIAGEITTDAKVIPTLFSRRLAGDDGLGSPGVDVFRRTAADLTGSVAVAAATATAPGRLFLALRGSGQALYVGLAEDAYVVASEPYGLVEEAQQYLRLDGETPADPTNPAGSRGQVVVLDRAGAGTVEGTTRVSYDGAPLPFDEADVVEAEITTRDIDRGDFPHYLLKEITEAPASFRKTLRGKLAADGAGVRVQLGPDTLPDTLRSDLAEGRIRSVLVIGQGTAAVAGQALARALGGFVDPQHLRVQALPATELSGFRLATDMSDVLVVAISQSGTTTDTNRTVDLARARGARVVAIVNRRRSDITDKVDGVLYTSDGRDVEMSVASTKAFYSQVAAGLLLASAIADLVGDRDGTAAQERAALLAALVELPDAMEAALACRPAAAAAAWQLAPPRRHWAVVGSGADRIAAEEIRIKLSELCYRAIPCDATEDKKHIDLSSEPLVVVCAAGLSGSNADDVAKEVAIYRAHKAAPVVIASEGEERFSAALAVITVPATHPQLAFVLAALAGHLFGYEAALAIDAQAVPLREARGVVEDAVTRGLEDDELLAALVPAFGPVALRFHDSLRSGVYDGHLDAGVAVHVASLLRYAAGITPLESYQVEHGRQGSPAVLVDDLTAALTAAIDQLTRPVDAIKHQAKTVTVGISRSDEGVLQVPLVAETLAAGAPRDRLTYRALRTLAALDPAVAEVTGFTRYRIDGDIAEGNATIGVVDRGGISLDLPLRTEANPALRGQKHRAASEREVTVAVGRSDGRRIVLVPEVKGHQCTGMTLLHVRFHENLDSRRMRSVLEGYRSRYEALRDQVTETEPVFRDDLLADQPVVDLLTVPVAILAARWRSE